MKKTVLRKAAILSAAALGGGGFAGAVLADNSNVTVYGTAMLFVDSVSKDNGVNGVTRMTSGTSNLGFRGSEDLGDGLKAIFQIETTVVMDQNGNPPTNNPLFPLRNTNVGLSGKWGTASGGNWDTPYKLQILDVGPVRGLNPFDNPLMNNPGFLVPVTTTQSTRTGTAADAAFNRRQGNSVMYWSPTVEGFSGRLAYSLNEDPNTRINGTRLDPTVWSASLRYEGVPGLSLRYAYERHKDYFGLANMGGSAPSSANSSSTDDANMLVASYTFDSSLGTSRLVGMVERLSYESDDTKKGAIDSRSRNAWEIYAQQNFGPHEVFVEYSRASAGDCGRVGSAKCSSNGLGADAWALGYVYNFSKRTAAYAVYYAIDNEKNAQYAVFPPASPTPPGTDAHAPGVGFIHTF